MERRNRSLKALKELIYIDSLDSYEKADALVIWYKDYLTDWKIEDFDLELQDLLILEELFFKNINFLNNHIKNAREEINNIKKLKEFLRN